MPGTDIEQTDNTNDTRQLFYERGLARCSQELLKQPTDEEERSKILERALEHLRLATGSSRAFLFENFQDPEQGFCSGYVAVAFDFEFEPNFEVSWPRKIPWSASPEEVLHALESGEPFGGMVEEVFDSKPKLLRTLQNEGVSAVLFFPIYLGERWWGYLRFDECRTLRHWTETELMLLGTAAELFASTIQRWEVEAALEKRRRYEEALLRCARILHQMPKSKKGQITVFNQALESLRLVVNADRAYLMENFDDPELGLCLRIIAEVCTVGVAPQIDIPSNQRFPWEDLPLDMRQALDSGLPHGGPVEQLFDSTPQLLNAFKNQENPLYSLQTFPIHIGEHWWGFIGFDDVQKSREWSSEEIRILRIASEVFADTLQRWQLEAALKQEIQETRQREERLRLLESVVVNTSEPVIITEAQSIEPPGPRILYVNEAFSKVTGYEAKEVIGKTPRFLQGPLTSRQELDKFRSALKHQQPLQIELINYRKDGSEFWVEMSVGPVFDDDGNCTHFVAVQREVTDRKRSENAIREARDELEIRVNERTRELSKINEQLRQEIAYREQAETEVKRRLAIEQSLGDIALHLVMEPDSRAILWTVLEDVARMVDARRAALVFLNNGGEQVADIYEWVSPETEPLEDIFLSNPILSFDWFRKQMKDSQSLFIENSGQLPPEAKREKQIIQELGADSLALFPIHIEGKLEAVFVCSNFAREDSQLKQQLDILNVVAGLLGTALGREALINSLEERAIDRSRELAAFYDMTMLASEVENLSDILEPALSHILELTDSDAVSIHELSPDASRVSLVSQVGWKQNEDYQVGLASDAFIDWFKGQRDPIIELDLGAAAWLPKTIRQVNFNVYLGAQLRARGKTIGLLSCYRKTKQPYSVNATALLVALAEQLGIIIENYRLRQQAEESLIIEERQRLARDLHDAVTQSLYGVSLFARSSVDALEEGDFNKVNETLREVELNALQALKEMRLLLHQLRPLALEQGGLNAAIESRLNQVERRLGIIANIMIDGSLKMSPRVEEAIYRIITEALNNSLKYANATKVDIVLRAEKGNIYFEVRDDGVGFDPGTSRSGMGIQNMIHRVNDMGGTLTLESSPESGTSAVVEIPAEWME